MRFLILKNLIWCQGGWETGETKFISHKIAGTARVASRIWRFTRSHTRTRRGESPVAGASSSSEKLWNFVRLGRQLLWKYISRIDNGNIGVSSRDWKPLFKQFQHELPLVWLRMCQSISNEMHTCYFWESQQLFLNVTRMIVARQWLIVRLAFD